MMIIVVPPLFPTPRRSRFSYSSHRHPQQLTKTKKVSLKRNVGNGNYPIQNCPPPPPPIRPARHALRDFEFILEDALHVHSAITATKKETKKGGKKEEGTWKEGRKEGRTNSRKKAGGREIEIPHCILPRLSLHFCCAFPAPPDL